MAYYLVRAHPRSGSLMELERRLVSGEVGRMTPFGRALSVALRGARLNEGGTALWEEEDYCSPPLREERAAVLDFYFDELRVEMVEPGAGWRQILELPYLFPIFAEVANQHVAGREALDWVRRHRRGS